MTVPTKGIHVQSAMKYLFRRLITNETLTDSYPRADMYNDDAHHFGGGSENMNLLYSAVGYIANHTAGRDRLLNWYANEQGHGGGEPLTVSHRQLHIGGHGAIALHAQRSHDHEILSLAIRWLQTEYHLLSLCEIDGEPWTPGARGVHKGKVVGENHTSGKFLRAVKGHAPKPNQYDLGACCVAKLSADVREDIASLPANANIVIQGDLSITRLPNGTFAAVFNTLPIREGGVQCAGYDGIERWIYRDANTPEAAVKIGQISRKLDNAAIVERYKSSPMIDIDTNKRKRPRKDKEKSKSMPTDISPKIPQSIAELNAIANLPFDIANGLISQANKSLVQSWGESLYPNFGKGYLHSSDHSAALVILLGREPTFREVYDSYHLSGSKNIDLARNKVSGGERPSEWDNWTDSQKLQAVLTQLYGIKNGSRILDGKMKDPNPAQTQALMKLWGLEIDKEPENPKEPDKPKEPDTPPVPVPPSSYLSAATLIKTRVELDGSRTTSFYAIGPQRDNEQQALEDAKKLKP